MQRKRVSLFAFLKIAVLWDQLNFISSLNFDTILGAVLLYQWLLRFVFKENGCKFISKPKSDPTVQCDTKLTQSQAQPENDQFLK